MKLPQLTEQEFITRYTNAPDEIREALDSEEARKSLLSLCRTHYLNPQKAAMLEQLVGLVLLGFIAPRDLAGEIGEHLYLNHEHARVLANEIHARIFEPILEELEGFYNPLEEGEHTEKPNEEGIKIDAKPVGTSVEAPISVELKEGTPLVLHEKASFFEDERPKLKKSFFPFFASSPESSELIPSVRVKIETPPEKKSVDYSESRSSLSPLGSSPEEFISLEALEKMRSAPLEIELPNIEQSAPATKPAENVSVPFVAPIIKTKDIVQTPTKVIAPEKKGFSWPLKLFKGKKEEIEPKTPAVTPAPQAIIPPSLEASPQPQSLKTTPETFGISLDASFSERKQPEIDGNIVHLK